MANANMGFTPGVYIQEQNAFGNSVVPAPTAVPAFIGYTQNTSYNGQDITFQPVKINSLTDFTSLFGSTAPQVGYGVTPVLVSSGVLADMNAVCTAAANAQGVSTSVKNSVLGTPAVAADPNANPPVVAADAVTGYIGNIASATSGTIGGYVTSITTALNTATALSPQNTADMAVLSACLSYANTMSMNLNEPSATTYEAASTAATPASGATATATQTAMQPILAALSAATSTKAVQAQITTINTALTAAKSLATPVAADIAVIQAILDYGNAVNDAILSVNYWSGGVGYALNQTTVNYRLYAAIKFFYENGGGTAYVYSIGGYNYSQGSLTDTTPFQTAIDLLVQETEPTMLVIPDAIELIDTGASDLPTRYKNCYSLQEAMLNHCGTQMNRLAILDIPGGWAEPAIGEKSYEIFRDQVSPILAQSNSYGAAYYPWLNTTVYQTSDVSSANLSTADTSYYATIFDMMLNEYIGIAGAGPNASPNPVPNKVIPYVNAFAVSATQLTSNPVIANITPTSAAHSALYNLSASYQLLINSVLTQMNLMAPCAGMAGIYTTVDNAEGVWVAPANVGIASVISPSLKIDDDMQADLNVPIDGKSVCAIRSFNGRGTLVWGARTLDGNSDDWRYINVRRTMMYIEQSVKDAAFAYVFAPNVAGTWIDVQSMISNFLIGLWSQGGLAGSKAEAAFSVAVGLGSTMTSQDILDGVMRVKVLVAISHPAEFIEITFQQQMQS